MITESEIQSAISAFAWIRFSFIVWVLRAVQLISGSLVAVLTEQQAISQTASC